MSGEHSKEEPPAEEQSDLIKSSSSSSSGSSDYQTSQRLPVFMGVPTGQLKWWLNSGKLASVPITLYRGGLWASVTSPSWALSGVRTEHHTYKKPKENNYYIENWHLAHEAVREKQLEDDWMVKSTMAEFCSVNMAAIISLCPSLGLNEFNPITKEI